MIHPSLLTKTDFDILNVVALKKMASVEQVITASNQAPSSIKDTLARLIDSGLIADVGDFLLPSNGVDQALKTAATDYYRGLRVDTQIQRLFDRFERINCDFLAAMTAWQQVEVAGNTVMNDHTDVEYDDKIFSRLGKLVSRLNTLVDALASYDARFFQYRERFAAAAESVEAGRHEYVSSPIVDSLHNIWFEFHEDLLRTLGRDRTE